MAMRQISVALVCGTLVVIGLPAAVVADAHLSAMSGETWPVIGILSPASGVPIVPASAIPMGTVLATSTSTTAALHTTDLAGTSPLLRFVLAQTPTTFPPQRRLRTSGFTQEPVKLLYR